MKCCVCPSDIVGTQTESPVLGVQGFMCEHCAEWAEALIAECGTNDVGVYMGFPALDKEKGNVPSDQNGEGEART